MGGRNVMTVKDDISTSGEGVAAENSAACMLMWAWSSYEFTADP